MRISDWSSDVCSSDLLGIRAGLDGGLLGTALGRAADVEGAHGELGARLADRLRGDDADRLADVHLGAAGEVAPVAGAADAAYRHAPLRRADEEGVEAGTPDLVGLVLLNEVTALHDATIRRTAVRARV